MVKNNGVDYRDNTPLSDKDIDDVNKLVGQDKYSSAGKKIANWLKTKLYGKPTRGAMALWATIIGDSTQKNHQIAKDSATKVDNIGQRFDDQIAGSTNDDEMIDLRHSDMLSKSFTTARKRGDFWDDELKTRGANVKWFGALGDGVSDDAKAFQKAIDAGLNVYVPDGEYYIGTTLVPRDEDTPVVINGQTPGGVVLKSNLETVIDFTSAKIVIASNLQSDSLIYMIKYSADDNDYMQDRSLKLDYIWNTSTDKKAINWNHLISAPKPPENYTMDSPHGGVYARYPFEIYNSSGFNALNINNYSQSTEASPIGITDYGGLDGPLSSPSLLIEQRGARGYMKAIKKGEKYSYLEGSGRDLAIGAKIDASDHGIANLKIGENTVPKILLIERKTNSAGSISYTSKGWDVYDGDTRIVRADKSAIHFPQSLEINSSSEKGIILKNGQESTVIRKDDKGWMRLGSRLIQYNASGPTAQRPNLQNTPADIGFCYFDRTLAKPVWWRGDTWITADFTTASLSKQVATLTAQNSALQKSVNLLGKQVAKQTAINNNEVNK